MWALEYDPDMFYQYEDSGSDMEKTEGAKVRQKSTRKCGKYERENMKVKNPEAQLPISVFLVASVLKDKSSTLLQEARGLDDVVQVTLHFRSVCSGFVSSVENGSISINTNIYFPVL